MTRKECRMIQKTYRKDSHCYQILGVLLDKGSVTQAEVAQDPIYCYRLSARIHDLRTRKDNPIPIRTESEPNKGYGSHARYFLEV